MNLSDNLKQIRKDNNLSQEALAEMLGVSRQSVSKWESGTAYPEMDKVLQICKLFNVNLDELMHEDIKLSKEKKDNKNSINKFVDDLLSYITKTINMFSSLSFKSKMACFFEQVAILIILTLVAGIIGSLLESMLSSILLYVPYEISNFISGLLGSIYGIIVFILIIIIWLHLFKSRYLDYYKEPEKEPVTHPISNDEPVEKREKTIQEPKVIIRDKSSDGGIFKSLFNLCLVFIKVLIGFISLGFIFCVIGFGILLALTFIFDVSTFFFWGGLITLISIIIINLICLKFIYDFIFNRKTRKGLIGIILGISLLTTGIGIGVFTIDVFKLDYISEIPNEEITIEKVELPIIDTIKYINVHPCDCTEGIECEFIETSDNKITIEVEHSTYTKIDVHTYDEEYYNGNEWIDVYYYIDENKISKYLDKVINDLNEYKVYDIRPNKIKIYAPKEVIDKMGKSE